MTMMTVTGMMEIFIWIMEVCKEVLSTRPGGGGGGVLTPNFGRYVPRQSEKWARAPERAPGRA